MVVWLKPCESRSLPGAYKNKRPPSWRAFVFMASGGDLARERLTGESRASSGACDLPGMADRADASARTSDVRAGQRSRDGCLVWTCSYRTSEDSCPLPAILLDTPNRRLQRLASIHNRAAANDQ